VSFGRHRGGNEGLLRWDVGFECLDRFWFRNTECSFVSGEIEVPGRNKGVGDGRSTGYQ